MLSDIWRFTVAACDYRAWWRKLQGKPMVDVVFITNLRDEAERQRFFGNRVPELGHANGPRIYHNGVAGRVRGIYSTAAEMLTKEGRRLARAQFIAACEWAEQNGAKIVLLAASTKRLFGRDGAVLKERFPNLMFTIGDNGTAQMLWADVERALERARLDRERARVLVVGPYGILGSCMTRKLVQSGYKVVGYGANETALAEIHAETGIPVTSRIDEVGQVDVVVACTHSTSAKLGVHGVMRLRRDGRKLLVIDVAEPANLDIDAYRIVRDDVVRQDAGNAWSSHLHYVLGRLSSRLLMLDKRVVFGCFGEALALHYVIHQLDQPQLADIDWFEVDEARTRLVAAAFTYAGFEPPPPCCFGKRVNDFNLVLERNALTAYSPLDSNTMPLLTPATQRS
ncbi:hypothetical protein [Chitinimonas sp. BJYL2]|uniref:hypothetical protein n=1 Tax=Chitinimonas sp. BJYL2 TaxID=2976696 RepID=UPI0022B4F7FC|nr:hypothetical protein [Chitinimonas sp. BJYL2]